MDRPEQSAAPAPASSSSVMHLADQTPALRRPKGQQLRRGLQVATVAWLFGSVWMNATAGTPVANFAKCLNASKFEFGVLAALPFLAALLSLPASLLTERTGQRKRIFLWGLYVQRLMWVPIALVPWYMIWRYGEAASGPAMFVFLAFLLVMHAAGTMGSPAWVAWMADLVPSRCRGRYFARRRQWGIVSAIPAAALAGWLLDRYAGGDGSGNRLLMLQWCAGIFVAAAIFGAMDIHLFHYVPDVPKAPQRTGGLFHTWRQPLRNRQFLFFAGFIATLLFAVSFMGQFVTLYIMDRLELANGYRSANVNAITQMMLLVVPAISQLFFLGVWGRAADRMGKRPVLILAGLGLVPVALGWCFVTAGHIWLGYVLSGLGAILWAGVEVANLDLVLEMSGSSDQANGSDGGGSGYFAISAVISAVAGFFGGLAAGGVAQVLENINFQWVTPMKTFTFYDVLFVLSGILRLLAVLLFVPHIHEADCRPTHEALRYMMANIYNNLYNAVTQPLRVIGLHGSRRNGQGSGVRRKL